MIKVFIAPRRYVQGAGALAEIGKYVAPLGKRALVVCGPTGSKLFAEPVGKSLNEHDIEMVSFQFSGECDRGQINSGIEKAKAENVSVVIGVGGGKAIDVSKAIAMDIGAKIVTVPTIASNDTPTSSATVYYTEDGVMEGWEVWPFNPDLVLVDTQVIANAPVRWLMSGVADGLATWFEAEASYKGRYPTIAGGVATMASLNLARLCYDTLMEYALDAKRDVEKHVVTPAVEKVVEANILLSGLGFESGGVASAHAVGNTVTMFEITRKYSHGERVAFGIVVQLCLDEDIRAEDRNNIVDFLIAAGLPVTFEDIGMGELSSEDMMKLADALVGEGQITHNHVFKVTAFDIYSAMIAADALGRSRKALAK